MSSQKGRAERYLEMFGDTDDYEDQLRQMCESGIDKENQEFWALYRALDISQSDVKQLVEPIVETSQSTVSRAIRQKDDEVVHDEDALRLGGSVHEDDVDRHPDEWLEAYKQTLAEAKADILALRAISTVEQQTPEWAARRFPELVGSHHHFADRLAGDVQIADDSHLNDLESVNTDRWK